MNKFNNCPKCNTDNPEEAKYCRNCGIKLKNVPIINSFLITPVIYVGESINFCWNVENADKITLDGKDVTNRQSIEYVIMEDKTIELVAYKNNNKVSRTIKIKTKPYTAINPPIVQSQNLLYKSNKHIKNIFLFIILIAFSLFITPIIHKYDNIVHRYIGVSLTDWWRCLQIIEYSAYSLCVISIIFLLYHIHKLIKKIIS